MSEAIGTQSIPAELSATLADHLQTVREDEAALTLKKRSDRGIHYFLAQVGRSNTRPGSGDIGQGLPIWNGASHELAIIRPG